MEGQIVTHWGQHVALNSPAIMVRRAAVSVGDVVHSSHYGRVTVESVKIVGLTVYLRFTEHTYPEAYDATSEIPSYTAYEKAEAQQSDLLEVAGLSKTLRDREATAYHTGHAAGQEEALAWALEQIREAYSLVAVSHTIGDRLRQLQRTPS